MCFNIMDSIQLTRNLIALKGVVTYDTITEGFPVCVKLNDKRTLNAIICACCILEYFVDENSSFRTKLTRVSGLMFGQEAVIVLKSKEFTEETYKHIASIELPEQYASELVKTELRIINATEPE